MTVKQAQDLLDRRRAGEDMPQREVLAALRLTGDYDCDFNPELTADLHELEIA